jgi:preprotein translocase subunit SecG
MENVILIVHLILALCLIGVVLLQRSEGGGLGMGGGGGNAMSARGAASALGKLTWGFAIAFICTSVALTIIAARNSANSSVVDRLGLEAPTGGGVELPPADSLLPPPSNDAPLAPPTVE